MDKFNTGTYHYASLIYEGARNLRNIWVLGTKCVRKLPKSENRKMSINVVRGCKSGAPRNFLVHTQSGWIHSHHARGSIYEQRPGRQLFPPYTGKFYTTSHMTPPHFWDHVTLHLCLAEEDGQMVIKSFSLLSTMLWVPVNLSTSTRSQ